VALDQDIFARNLDSLTFVEYNAAAERFRMKRALLIISALLLVGCLNEKNERALIEKFAPKEEDEFARRFVDLLREGRFAEVGPMLDPDVAAKAGVSGLNQLHQILDHGQPSAFELIGVNVTNFMPFNGSGAKHRANLLYQLRFHDAWVVATVVVESTSRERHVVSVYVQPVSDSLQVLNQFTLRNQSIAHYLVLAACILIPLLIAITAVLCLRTRVRRRWLWVVFILIGFVQVKFNWTTGAVDVQPLSFSLLGAGWFRASSYAPVILIVAFPLGAIVFLICRSRLRRKGESQPLTPEIATDPNETM